ncbi:MAG: glucosamine-6-phosphate deaminase [Ornithinimicrobium sp.]
MEIVILRSAEEGAQLAADMVAEVVANRSTSVLGLATGSSPLALYAELARRRRSGALDFGGTRAFALDEYVGLPSEHPQSYASIIRDTVAQPLGLDPATVHVPDGSADDLVGACRAYEQAIQDAGGVDVQILGIGANGHIGFNEPTSSFASRTRVKTLSPQTRSDNARFFDHPDRVPEHCITQGLGTIAQARRLVLLAQGKHKAPAVAAMVEGPLAAICPASLLQMHPDATVILDEPAASALTMSDYYDYVYEHKPAWQRHGPTTSTTNTAVVERHE